MKRIWTSAAAAAFALGVLTSIGSGACGDTYRTSGNVDSVATMTEDIAPGANATRTGKPTTSKGTSAASTGEDASCTEAQDLDRYRMLRRLSLDLRNRLPSLEEYMALDAVDAVPESTLDAWIASDDFRVAMRRYHESLLWTNPEGVQLAGNDVRLAAARMNTGTQQIQVYLNIGNGRRNLYRGSPQATCGAYPQTAWNSDGSPVAKPVYDDANPEEVAYYQEGYVTVKPYWAPSSEISVCAFDAQTATQGSSAACDTLDGVRDPKCGCGPDLRWCYGPQVQEQIWTDLREQVGHAIDEVTAGGAPYTELIRSSGIFMNGRLAFWKKHLAHMGGFQRTYNGQGPGDPALPDAPDYLDATWTRYERSDVHSGVLTLPGYSLRFQTDRGRANRFRIAFTGQYFVPPSQPEDPATSDCDASNSDLTRQCTCRGCHQVLEPLAAHFGKVMEAGSTLMSDFASYEPRCDPRENEDAGSARSCERFYAVADDAQNPGWLLALQYAYMDDPGHNNDGLDDALHRSIYDNYLAGPGALAQETIDSGQLATATVENLFRALMGRDMNLDSSAQDNEVALLSELATDFQQGYSFPALVKRLVMLPQYRRVR